MGFFFFFQAEDGIRDADVTGVQTCALPICTWYERKQLYRMTPGEDGAQRLWRVGDGDAFNLEPIDAAKAGTTPLLVFLHGTASSTRGSFGELWAPSARVVRNQILAPYRGNVYAFEHFSLTQSPMQNALELLDALPDGATLHLVSHSRGGLIGELLCRGQMAGGEPFDNADIDRDAQLHRHPVDGELLGNGRARHRRAFPRRAARAVRERRRRRRAHAWLRLRDGHARRGDAGAAANARRLRASRQFRR